jgi:hypothetical protein
MNKPLTEKDIKEIKYQCRMGFILPGMLLIFSNFMLFVSILVRLVEIERSLIYLCAFTINLIPLVLCYLMNWKYLVDLKNGEKVGELKTIQRKELKHDFEAGSGNVTLNISKEMNEFIRYDIIVENTRYQIDNEFSNNCNSGDEVVFYYAPKSKYLIEIVLKNNYLIVFSSFYD